MENRNKKLCVYKNLFDELVYNLAELKSNDSVIKFLWEKTFGGIEKNQPQAKFDQMKKEI